MFKVMFIVIVFFTILTNSAFAQSFDTVILNGRVIDPETGLDAIRNVAIKDGEIAAISEFSLEGDVEIDASGKIVAPGFIDLHAHGMAVGDMRMQAMQGVTTILELESGVLPIGDWYDAMKAQQTPLNYGAAVAWTFARIAAFSGKGPKATPAYFQDAQTDNEWKQDIANPDQFTRIMNLVETGLKEGGIGIGVNAGYAPGYGQKEYFELAKLAKEYNVPTYSHVRYIGDQEPGGAFDAVQELIGNAAITGAHMHICHINSTSIRDIKLILDLVERAQSRGIKVTAEAYPYGAGNTVIGAAMFSGNWQKNLKTSAEAFQLGEDRMTEAEVADMQKKSPGTFITWHYLDENISEDLALIDASVTHPAVMIASDAVFWSYFDKHGVVRTYTGDEWPLPKNVFSHPRSSGAFSKVLRSYVRERGLLSMSEAIHKMSLMPAQMLEDSVPQMKSKGRIQIGMDADILVFDPETVADLATYANANQPSVGVQTVLVNGGFVVRDGKLVLEANGGEAIRRQLN